MELSEVAEFMGMEVHNNIEQAEFSLVAASYSFSF